MDNNTLVLRPGERVSSTEIVQLTGDDRTRQKKRPETTDWRLGFKAKCEVQGNDHVAEWSRTRNQGLKECNWKAHRRDNGP